MGSAAALAGQPVMHSFTTSLAVTLWIAVLAKIDIYLGVDPLKVGITLGGLWVFYVIGLIYINTTEPK